MMIYTDQDAWREIIEQARRTGTARGLPKPPAGLLAVGGYSLTRTPLADGAVKRTLYYGVKGDWTTVGWYVEGAAEAPPQANGTGPKPARSGDRPEQTRDLEPAAIELPAPLIMLTPAAGGAWRLSGYGVETGTVITALRLALVHLVARQSGVTIIDEVIAPEFAVVPAAGSERLPRLPQPRSDRKARAGGKVQTTVRYPDEYEDGYEDE